MCTFSLIILLAVCVALFPRFADGGGPTQAELIDTVLKNSKPLEFPRGKRFPLFTWSIRGVGTDDPGKAEERIRKLDAHGFGVFSTWNPNSKEKSLAEGLMTARIQQKLGLRVCVDANACVYHFCDGSPDTAHVDANGKKFFDMSFHEKTKMGCPFAMEGRYAVIAEQVESFAREYKKAGLKIDFAFADWEIDGAIEWNEAWAHSKRCVRCMENIPGIENFEKFQSAIRKVRCRMQKESYADALKKYFPEVLVGNYGVYPHEGVRYWYDWFEKNVEGAPFVADQKAKYRKWFHEFALTGFTYGMPVVYTWIPTFTWYNYKNPDYRWFYNMLLVASNAGKSTPADIPLMTFVHWNTVAIPGFPENIKVTQMSEEAYQELMWHILLRGHDGLFIWCPRSQTPEETRLVHEVYAASLEFADFLNNGTPVTFHVPKEGGPVVSAVKLGDRLLVRRTDFTDDQKPVTLEVQGVSVTIPRVKGKCQVLDLKGAR